MIVQYEPITIELTEELAEQIHRHFNRDKPILTHVAMINFHPHISPNTGELYLDVPLNVTNPQFHGLVHALQNFESEKRIQFYWDGTTGYHVTFSNMVKDEIQPILEKIDKITSTQSESWERERGGSLLDAIKQYQRQESNKRNQR